MSTSVIHEVSKAFIRSVPDLRPGCTVRVYERVLEGEKERIQTFEGLIISIHKGHVPTDRCFTVRRIVSGVGVEKVFSLYSPSLEKIEVKKVAKVRRAKLYFLRGRAGKSARLVERFTGASEFASQAVPSDVSVDQPVAETPSVDATPPVDSSVEAAA